MLSPVPMLRLSVVVLECDERAALRELGHLGAVQLTREPAGEDTAPLPPRDRSRNLARCDRLRTRLTELRRSLSLEAGPAPVAPADLTFEQAEAALSDMETRAQEWLNRQTEALKHLQELDGNASRLAGLERWDAPLHDLERCEYLHFALGSLPEGALARLDVGTHATILPLPALAGRQPVLAVTTRSRQNDLEETLGKAGFQPEPPPPAVARSAAELRTETHHDQRQIETELTQVNSNLKALTLQSAEPLARLEAWTEVERQLLQAEGSFPRTAAAVLITGWIPEDAVPEVTRLLRERVGGRCVLRTLPAETVQEEEIPVLLRHSPLVRPFELLVSAYGLPRYGELAPTFFVAVSYLVMFGMMFGDVGHGGLLALTGLVLLLRSRATRARDLGVLLCGNGLSSIVFGAVYGSYFGLPSLKEHALWRDPLEGNPMTLMAAAVGIGIALMSLGLVLNIRNRLRHRQWLEGLLGRFGLAGLVFYWSALMLLAQAAAQPPPTAMAATWVCCLGIPLACWMLKEPLQVLLEPRTGDAPSPGGWVAAIIESCVGAFEGVLLYLANTVSFVRLAAYALSHAALLVATFTLAAEVGRMAAGGPVWSLIVVILGNLVAVLLEGIVAAVQALRLEYYEFFGKFFSGEGRPFTPFRLAGSSP